MTNKSKILILFCFLLILSCTNKDTKKSETKTNIDQSIDKDPNIWESVKKHFDATHPGYLNAKGEFRKIEENDSEIVRVIPFDEKLENDDISGSTVFYKNESLKGDLNNDGLADYLVNAEGSGGGTTWWGYYEIYIQNDQNAYTYVGEFSCAGKDLPRIYFNYVKDGKVYGVWTEAWHAYEAEKKLKEKDVVYELKGSTLVKSN
jgi:hypothetical protein